MKHLWYEVLYISRLIKAAVSMSQRIAYNGSMTNEYLSTPQARKQQ
jgi:hypothetical protein